MSQTFLYLFLTASVLSAMPVCAQSRNAETDAAFSAAGRAMAVADAAQARELAPDEYRSAELALQEADALSARRKNKEAKHKAVLSRLYADLAAAKARYILSKEGVEQKISDNQALRRELLLGGEGLQP